MTHQHRSGRSHLWRFAGIAAIAALLGAACGDDAATTTAENTDGTGAAATAGSGGTLTIQGDAGNPTLVENFHPLQPSSALHGVNLIYEPLELRSPIDGSFSQYLATAHEFTDPTTLVYTLRDGVTWSDGTAFTADDVVFTFTMLKDFPALDSNGVWQQISGVEAAGNVGHVHLQRAERPVRRCPRCDGDSPRSTSGRPLPIRRRSPTPRRSALGRSCSPSSRRRSTS